MKELHSLSSWHQEAENVCKALTAHVQKGDTSNALWLLHCLLGAHWTPVLKPPADLHVFEGYHPNWAEGWHALWSMCTSNSAWYCNVYDPLPFCKWRGCKQCVCMRQCGEYEQLD
jgi:hypothetical protein